MRFVLVYDGPLSASQRKKPAELKELRTHFHHQILALWETSHALRKMRWDARVPDGKSSRLGIADSSLHNHYKSEPPSEIAEGYVDLVAQITRKNRKFQPLVRDSMSLTCRLNIHFLRADEPGDIRNNAGDIDNRIKTLLDALEAPANDASEAQFDSTLDCTYCLLEDDRLVTALNVKTDRLLTATHSKRDQVQLIIEVLIDVSVVGRWNHALIGNGF